jgi:photosystem II stability/assembly factor-like uncharacterized protein
MTFAGAEEGSIYASPDLGKTWELRDKGLTEKNIFSLNFTQVGNTVRIYAGTEPAHLFVTEDLGKSWRELESLQRVPSQPQWTYPRPPHIAHVRNINFDPKDPDTVYASIEQGGLFRSRDVGRTWEELHGFDKDVPWDLDAGSFPDDVHRMAIRPTDPNWLYTLGGAGICRTKDGGKTWEHLTKRFMQLRYPDGLVIHPERPELMFVAGAKMNPKHWRTERGADTTIARSRDGGDSWEPLHGGLPEQMYQAIEAFAMETWAKGFALYAGTTSGELLYSEDEGEHWVNIAAGSDLKPIAKGVHHKTLQRPAASSAGNAMQAAH